MKIEQCSILFQTSRRGTQNITEEVDKLLVDIGVNEGLCHLFLKHTSASLMICENYDTQVRVDLENFLVRLVPDGDPLFKHVEEGNDDMPAHIRTVLTQTSLTIPIHNGKLALGTWQGIYLYEHRFRAQERQLVCTVVGH